MAGRLSHILRNRQGAPECMVEIIGLERHTSYARNLLQQRDDHAALYITRAAQGIRPAGSFTGGNAPNYSLSPLMRRMRGCCLCHLLLPMGPLESSVARIAKQAVAAL